MRSCAWQPVNADGATGGVAPKLDELLNGKDSGQVFYRSAILGMATFQLWVGERVYGEPADMSQSDDV